MWPLKKENTKMSELHNIPLIYKAGAYSLAGFSRDIDDDDAISFDYDAQYQMLTYDIPVGEDWRGMTLYNVSEDDLIRTLRAVYGKDGALQNVTAILGGHETLLYIRYENRSTPDRRFGALLFGTRTPLLNRSGNVRMLWQGFSSSIIATPITWITMP